MVTSYTYILPSFIAELTELEGNQIMCDICLFWVSESQ